MDRFAVTPSTLCPNSVPVKTHADRPGTRLPNFTGRAAMQSIHDDCPSMSATRGSASLSLATDADDPMATTHGQPQSPQVPGSPVRPIRHIMCPGAPKKQLPTRIYRARTEAANSDSQCLFTPPAPLRQDREAYNILKLTSRANSVESTQDLLNRLICLGATPTLEACTNTTIKAAAGNVSVLDYDDGVDNELETSVASLGRLAPVRLPQQAPRQGMTRGPIASCSHAEGPRMKRIKSIPTFGAAATAEPGSLKTAARMSGHCTQEALEGTQQDHGHIKADDPVDSVLKGLGRNCGGANQPLPLLNSLDGGMALGKSSGRPCINSAAPEATFTQGSNCGCSQTCNRGHYARRQPGPTFCAQPARVPKDGSARQGMFGSIAPLTQASNFFPNGRQQLFVSSFNVPMDSPPSTFRPFFNLPQL